MGQQGILLRLVEAMDLIDESTVDRPWLSSSAWASSMACRMSFTPASTAEMAMNRLSVALAARRPRVVLPTPGGPRG